MSITSNLAILDQILRVYEFFPSSSKKIQNLLLQTALHQSLFFPLSEIGKGLFFFGRIAEIGTLEFYEEGTFIFENSIKDLEKIYLVLSGGILITELIEEKKHIIIKNSPKINSIKNTNNKSYFRNVLISEKKVENSEINDLKKPKRINSGSFLEIQRSQNMLFLQIDKKISQFDKTAQKYKIRNVVREKKERRIRSSFYLSDCFKLTAAEIYQNLKSRRNCLVQNTEKSIAEFSKSKVKKMNSINEKKPIFKSEYHSFINKGETVGNIKPHKSEPKWLKGIAKGHTKILSFNKLAIISIIQNSLLLKKKALWNLLNTSLFFPAKVYSGNQYDSVLNWLKVFLKENKIKKR